MTLSITKISRLEEHCNEIVNLLGVVISCKDVVKTRGNDYLLNLSLSDDSCSKYQKFIKVSLFRKTEKDLPLNARPGAILYMKKIKIYRFDGSIAAMSNFKFAYALFLPNGNSVALDSFSNTISVCNDLIKKANEIFADHNSLFNPTTIIPEQNSISTCTMQPMQSNAVANNSWLRFKTFAELTNEESRFDFYGEILSISATKFADSAEVLLTDYSFNSEIASFLDVPDLGMNGISKEMIFSVKFWDKNASILDVGHVGDYILCRKIHYNPKSNSRKNLFSLRKLYDSIAFELIGESDIEKHSTLIELRKRKMELTFSCIKQNAETVVKDSCPLANNQTGKQEIISEAVFRRNQIADINPDLVETKEFINDESIIVSSEFDSDEIPSCLSEFIKSVPDMEYYRLDKIASSLNRPFQFLSSFAIHKVTPFNSESVSCLFCANCKLYHSDLDCECRDCGIKFDILSYAYRFVIQVCPYPILNKDSTDLISIAVNYQAGNELMNGIVPTNLNNDEYSCELVKRHIDFLISSKPIVSSVLCSLDTDSKEGKFLLCLPLKVNSNSVDN